jgi:hypothetical protein
MRRVRPDIAGMSQPARCLRCSHGVYDLGTVEVTARYTDCSMWKSPCCGSVVDDRGETGWTTRKDYERIDPNSPYPGADVYGRVLW